MVTRKDYLGEAVEAARSVMIELVHLLGEYRESLVLIGGWVPELLLPSRDKPHVGSIDVDLALDHRSIHAEGYRTIQASLLGRGYLQGKQPFIFHRKVPTGGRENSPLLLTAGPPSVELDAAQGINLYHPTLTGYYPYLRFVGGTVSRDLTFLRKLLLGISPVLRLETFYAFSSSYVRVDPSTLVEAVERHNELRWAIGLDWKIRIPMISQSGITIQPQFFQQHIFGLPAGASLTSTTGVVQQNNYAATIFLRTAYLNERLTVSDDGVGLPPLEVGSLKSLGLRLVSDLALYQLKGEMELLREGGTTVRVRFRERERTGDHA
jgi:hypothetical protein